MKKKYYALNEAAILIDNYLYPRVLILNDIEAKAYPLTSTGVLILSLCDGMHCLEDIINIVAKKYNINKKIVKKDASMFLSNKQKENIVEVLEKQNLRKIEKRGKENIILPYQLSIETTNRCQLKCKHCYNKSGLPRKNELTIDRWIEILSEYKNLGGTSVMLTGGEIFLKDEVEKLIEYVAKNFFRIVVLTNGYTLTDKMLELLVKYKDKLTVQISLDGMEQNHDENRGVTGAFEKTIQNISQLVNKGLNVGIACTLNEKNIEDLSNLIKTVKEIGCFFINIGVVSSIGRAEENDISAVEIISNLRTIIQKMREKYADESFSVGESIEEFEDVEGELDTKFANKCGSGYKILHIFSDGRIGLCPSHGSIIDDFTLGDVSTSSLEEVLDYSNIGYVINIPNPSKKICGDCKLYAECAQCIVSMLNKSAKECVIKRSLYEKRIISA